MRIYFFSPLISTTELNERYQQIVEVMLYAGVFLVASNDENNSDFKKEELERMNESGDILPDKLDCFVIEA